MGFVVGNIPAGNTTAWYIVRAVGPSLSQFGITNADRHVTLTLTNSKGQALPGPGIPYAFDVNASFALVGAFPLVSGTAGDAYLIVPLPSGIYTARVSDSSGNGGQVLIEAYASPTPVIVAE